MFGKAGGRRGDSFDLQRFVDAQEDDYAQALAEIRAGRKMSHWIWYVFPQLKGLGRSYLADYYGISGMQEAQAYLAHPVLGARLREIARATLALDASDPVSVMGDIDALKLRSCLTLFREAAVDAADRALFQALLDKWHHGESDRVTLRMLEQRG